jgi:hypothetical protein
VSAADVRAIFGSASAGQILFAVNKDQRVVEGKTKWPALLQVNIDDPMLALETAHQLIGSATRALMAGDKTANITLLFGGQAVVSD